MRIGFKTIDAARDLLGDLLLTYREKLNEAYLRSEDSLDVSLKLKIRPDQGGNRIKADISFVSERVTDTAGVIVDEDQMKLEFEITRPGHGDKISEHGEILEGGGE